MGVHLRPSGRNRNSRGEALTRGVVRGEVVRKISPSRGAGEQVPDKGRDKGPRNTSKPSRDLLHKT
jgi:hypothetical protein